MTFYFWRSSLVRHLFSSSLRRKRKNSLKRWALIKEGSNQF
jgi:hypothetical protein